MPTIQFAAPHTSKPSTSSIYTRPEKKQKMSITQTYFLAHSARGKLSKEAGRSDHNLRLLVGHANLLDSLMLDLANAEQEQEQWFTKSVSQSEEAIEEEDDWEVEDVDSDSEIEFIEDAAPEKSTDSDEEDYEEDDEEDYGDLALTRTASRHEAPPELSSDSESDSEDEPMPPSPPSTTVDFPESIRTPSKDASLSESQQHAFLEEGFYLPSRQQQSPQPMMIAAY